MRSHDLAEGRDPDAGFDLDTYFLHDLPPEVLAEVTAGGDEEPADSLFSSTYDLSDWPDVPTAVLAARYDRFFPYEFQRRVAKERLGSAAEQIPGAHLCAYSHPDALVERLLRDPAGTNYPNGR
jgi:hypothetical protein